jgi:hypothetical protein
MTATIAIRPPTTRAARSIPIYSPALLLQPKIAQLWTFGDGRVQASLQGTRSRGKVSTKRTSGDTTAHDMTGEKRWT